EFTMNDPTDGSFIGGCGLNGINRVNGTANLGYWVRTGWTRRGVATAATLLLAEFGIRHAGLTRIEILTATGNRASRRVAEKAGATREGVLRNRLLVHGKLHDAVLYSVIPGDLPGAA
ncbi:MAG: GNAT family protein, partial [Dehalococcoidales bacterium]